MIINEQELHPKCWEEAMNPALRGRGVILSADIVADALGISLSTTCRLLRNGELKGVRVGKQWRVSRDWLIDYLGLEEAS